MTDPTDPALLETGSPLLNHLGMALTEWSEGRAVVGVSLTPELMNRQGMPHGGLHATLLDSAMGFAGCYTGDPDDRQMAVTLSLTVNYIGLAAGGRLIAEGLVTGGGRKTFFCDGRLTDERGTLVATATGVFRYRSAATGAEQPKA